MNLFLMLLLLLVPFEHQEVIGAYKKAGVTHTFTRVQNVGAGFGGTNTCTIDSGSAGWVSSTAGSLIDVVVFANDTSLTVSSVTDSGDTFTLDTTDRATDVNSGSIQHNHVLSGAGSKTSITVTLSG